MLTRKLWEDQVTVSHVIKFKNFVQWNLNLQSPIYSIGALMVMTTKDYLKIISIKIIKKLSLDISDHDHITILYPNLPFGTQLGPIELARLPSDQYPITFFQGILNYITDWKISFNGNNNSAQTLLGVLSDTLC